MSDLTEVCCNVCGGFSFGDFRGRTGVLCLDCGSLERQRMCLEVYRRLIEARSDTKILHMAPERCLQPFFNGLNCVYLTSDANPSIYSAWTKALRLRLPEGFEIFPDGYFNYIIHNHVLEHIPGDWRSHIDSFVRILDPKSGKMIFSVPGPIAKGSVTVDGGEFLPSDADRLVRFGQDDHYKKFGYDLLDYIAGIRGVNCIPAAIVPQEILTRHRAGERIIVLERNLDEV